MAAYSLILLVAFLFQVDAQHPPIVVKLTPYELNRIHLSTPTTTPEPDKVKDDLIALHQPEGQPKSVPCTATKDAVSGYHGHRYFDDKLVYVWEVPKCGK